MKAATWISWLAGAGLIVTGAMSVRWARDARVSAAHLQASRQERSTWEVRLSQVEEKLRRAERLAAEAEQDRVALLQALKAIRAAETTPAPPPPPITSDSRAEQYKTSDSDALPQEQQIAMAQERAYAQGLAKKRKEEATRRAEFEGLLRDLDPVAKFYRRLETAAIYAEEADFQAAIRVSNQAMAEKPPDLPLPESAEQLVAMLREQNMPVVVALISDGSTFVSVNNVRYLKQFVENRVEILPGNYEVVGRRPGYRDVVIPLQLRAGAPPPVVTVICTQLLQ